MDEQKQSRWMPALIITAILASNAVALTINAITSSGSGWGLGLDNIRKHPIPWLLLFLVISIATGLATWRLQVRSPASSSSFSRQQARRALSHERVIPAIDGQGIPWTRDAVVSEIIDGLAATGPVTFLVGLPGSGKTPLLAQTAERLRSRFSGVLAVSFDGPAAIEPGYLISRLNEALAAFGRELDEQVLQRTGYQRAMAELAALISDLPLLLVIDRLDEAPDDWQSIVLSSLTNLRRARVLAAGRRRPPVGTPALIVEVGPLNKAEAAGLAVAAARSLHLSSDPRRVLERVPDVVAQHPQSLLFTLAQADRLPQAVVASRYAEARPLSSAVEEIIRPLTEPDLSLLARLAVTAGLPAAVVATLPVFASDAGIGEGEHLLRSSVVEALEPVIHIPAIVQSALAAVAANQLGAAAKAVVDGLLRADLVVQAAAAPMIAYRLTAIREPGQIRRICQQNDLLDYLNRTGRWDDYLALLRLGVDATWAGDRRTAVQLLLRMARKLPQRGDLVAAQSALDSAVMLARGLRDRSLPGLFASHRGQLDLFRNDPEAARRNFLSALRRFPGPAQKCVIHKQLGHAYEMLGQTDRAYTHYLKAAKVGPPGDRHAFEARLNMGLLRMRTERVRAGVIGGYLRDRLQEARKFDPPYPAGLARASLAVALLAAGEGDMPTAVGLARSVLTMTQTDPRLRYKAVELLSRWDPPVRARVASRWEQLTSRLRRLPGKPSAASPDPIDEYQASIRELYQWSDGRPYTQDEVISKAGELRSRLADIALGTGMDRRELQSVFDKVDTWTVTLIDG